MEEKEWIILNYMLPKEPSRVRVGVWRKLKKQGSVIIGQSTWVLPNSEEHIRFFQGILQEIRQNKGEAYVMQAAFINDNSKEDIEGIFNHARDIEYTEVLEKCEDFFQEIEKETKKNNFTYAEMEENEYEYNKLVAWFQDIRGRDFFGAALKGEAEQQLNKCRQELESFSKKIYDINDEIGRN